MAFITTDLTADQIAFIALDKPILIGKNSLEDASLRQWRTSGSFTSGSDGGDPDLPASNGSDGYHHKLTKPLTANVIWYYIIQWPTTPPGAFDTMVILQHNFKAVAASSVTLEISNNSNFIPALEVASVVPVAIVPGKPERRISTLFMFDGGDPGPNLYTNVTFARLKIVMPVAAVPSFGELWLGQRHQLRHKPNLPYDDKALESSVTRFDSKSGIITDYKGFTGRSIKTVNIESGNPTEQADIDAWFAECDFGTKTFLWFENPGSNEAEVFPMKLSAPALSGQLQAPGIPGDRIYNFKMAEQGPFRSKEG